MKLKILYISRDWQDASKFTGTIEIDGKAGETKLNLTEEQTRKILDIVADALVESAREVALTLTAECIEYRKQRVIEG